MQKERKMAIIANLMVFGPVVVGFLAIVFYYESSRATKNNLPPPGPRATLANMCDDMYYTRTEQGVFGTGPFWTACQVSIANCFSVERHLPQVTRDALELVYRATGKEEFTQREFSAIAGDTSCQERDGHS